jgi:hypothetical protein
VLDRFGVELQKFAGLRVEIAVSADRTEQENVVKERELAIAAYLADKWKIESERVELKANDLSSRGAVVAFTSRKPNDSREIATGQQLIRSSR